MIKQAQTDGASYAIKISTAKYPQYQIEGQIYKRFRQIMIDPNEPNKDFIKKHILTSYTFGSIFRVTDSTQFIINITDDTDDTDVVVSASTNRELFYAIKNLATEHNVDDAYYYTTESMIDQSWNTLGMSKYRFSDDAICRLMTNVFQLLTYLHVKYQFIHWDLHANNIFVDGTDLANFKIYDFDMSEIQSNNTNEINTSTNNTIFDVIFEGHALQKKYVEMNRITRNNMGLIFAIYRVFNNFPHSSYMSCNDDKLGLLVALRNKANEKILSASQWEEHDMHSYLLHLAEKISEDITNVDQIRQVFFYNKTRLEAGPFVRSPFVRSPFVRSIISISINT